MANNTTDALSMEALEDALPTIKLDFAQEDWDGLAMIPWYSFRIHLPERPLPEYASRPALRTARLVLRPIQLSDLAAFHALRLRPETQAESTERGRPDHDEDETRRFIERLHDPGCENWYFGAWLAGADGTEGDMVGEGGLPDLLNTRAGWPEAEILLKKEYWRQGYGTEFWHAFTDSWWSLPRETRRHQLMPAIVPFNEPGDLIHEGIGVTFENHNEAARGFFGKMFGEGGIQMSGSLETIDFRDGRHGELVIWSGTLIPNPNEAPRSRSTSRSRSPSILPSRSTSRAPSMAPSETPSEEDVKE